MDFHEKYKCLPINNNWQDIFHLYFAPPPPIFPEEIDKTTSIDNEKKFTSLVLSEVL